MLSAPNLRSVARRVVLAIAMVAALTWGGGIGPAVYGTESESLDRAAIDERFGQKLEELAAKCDELQLPAEAAATRAWQVPRDGRRQYLFLPQAKDPTQPAGTATPLVRQWHAKFRSLRAEHAAELFGLAQRALKEGQGSVAYQLLHEVLRDDPDHAAARRALGFVKGTNGDWLPKPATWRAVTGRTDHPRFGWRRGQYWRVETTHYQIVTDHSAKAALELAETLENLVVLWKQAYFDFWADDAWLAAKLSGSAAKEPLSGKMQVVLFKNRDEYVAVLGPSQPQIELSLGIYIDTQKTAFFYAAEPSPRSTWLHEATHQLFQEIGRHKSGAGEERNFWIIEGAAMYMESLAEHDGYWTVGGWEAERVQPARYRALSGDFYLPLEQLVLLGRTDMQQHADIRKLYTQAAGFTHFLLDGNDGEHRKAAIDYLRSVYQQSDEATSLAAATKTSLAELDKQYLAWLNVTDDDLATVPDVQRITQLSLGRTDVTDAGLAHLAPCKALTWLDLSHTKASDAGLAHLAGATKLDQLFLEGSQVTAESLPLIARFKELRELDLSRLAIDDASLAQLKPLKGLKTLYLAGTPITDDALPHLRELKSLEALDLRGTRITPAGVESLQKARPKLQIDAP